MKKIFMLFIILMCVFACSNASAKDIEIYMFGKEIVCDVPPVAENGRTLVPVRAISEDGLGADVEWHGETQQVTVEKDGLEILLTLGDTKVIVNGEEEELDVPAKAISGRTMVPVRFISETLDYKVEWDSENYRVVIEENLKGYIEKIDVEETVNDNLLNVALSIYNEPEIFTLKEPYRIVLDLEKTAYDGHDDKIDVNSGFIKQVRWANHDDYYRIVVESQGEQPYKLVQTSDNSFSIIIGSPSTKVDLDELENKEEEEDKKENSDSDKEDDDNSDSGNGKDRDSAAKRPSGKGILVVIDPGHGGKDPGALARDEEGEIIYDDDDKIYIKEKDVNLAVALNVYNYLIKDGVNVMMTRDKDEFLELRDIADVANEAEATLFVSIHSNSVDGIPTAEGTEVLYYDTDEKSDYGITSKKLADNIQKSVVKYTDMFDRGLRERPGLAVLKWTEMPAALVELGFLTNKDDQEKLIDPEWQDDMAWAIAKGIIESIDDIESFEDDE